MLFRSVDVLIPVPLMASRVLGLADIVISRSLFVLRQRLFFETHFAYNMSPRESVTRFFVCLGYCFIYSRLPSSLRTWDRLYPKLCCPGLVQQS
jgi:hypothetical protein